VSESLQELELLRLAEEQDKPCVLLRVSTEDSVQPILWVGIFKAKRMLNDQN
jgi:hypothetical protein